MRDRAIVYVLLSTGVRREELVNLDLDQVAPTKTEDLRKARQAKITRVLGKGKTQREVFLSADARLALADYLEHERPKDTGEQTTALFLSATGSRPGPLMAGCRRGPSTSSWSRSAATTTPS